jgi:hypothetical protein
MEKSITISELSKALALFHVKMGTIIKDSTNPFFKSKYASLNVILDSILIPLAESGLVFTQFPTSENGLTTLLIHAESGEYVQDTFSMKPIKDDPQGRGSVITYQRRYALSSILGLNIDEDDDGNTATFGASTPEKAAENSLPWLNENTKEFTGAVEKLKAGKSSIPALRQYFRISKSVEQKLLA